jgi:hypothetical protein
MPTARKVKEKKKRSSGSGKERGPGNTEDNIKSS